MVDKWDEMTERMQKALLAQEPDAALAAGLQFFAEFGRTLELLGADVDRLATAAERLVAAAERIAGEPAP